MSWLEFNKIIASIIVAALIIGFISFVGNFLINVNKDESSKTAYVIEIPEPDLNVVKTNINDSMDIEPISNLLQNASLEKGEKIFKKCSSCHNDKKDSSSKVGPTLWNIINSPKGNVDGFAYSKALKESGGKWTFEELSKFLYKPKTYISGTKMNFVGLKNVEDRANLILWLNQNSDNPSPLP